MRRLRRRRDRCLPMLALPVTRWAPAALLLAGFTGAGALCVEIMTETAEMPARAESATR